MTSQELLKGVKGLLEEHESAPSAVNFVIAHVFGKTELDISDVVYEMNKGFNDSLRNNLLELCSDEQLRVMIKDIESWIVEEHLLSTKEQV